MKKMIWVLLVTILPNSALASTWHVAMAPYLWQYEESSIQHFGIGKTPFQSKAQGTALGVAISNTKTWRSFLLSTSWDVSRSMTASQEQWKFRQGMQDNRLAIQQSEFKLEIMHAWQPIQLGLWSSYQWHEQSRSDFVVNGIATPILGEPIKETVQVIWLGANISIPWQAWKLGTSLGMPAWVQTSNTLISQKFHIQQGYRLHTSLHYQLPQSPLSMQADYSFRQLGGERLANGWLWPKNRWQTASFGVSCAW